MPRLLFTVVLFASAVAASSSPLAAPRKVQAHIAQPGAAGAKCELTPERSPALYGFRLGMTEAEVAGHFPEFPDLLRFGSATESIEWKDATGGRALSGEKEGFGYSILRVNGRYFGRRIAPGERIGEFAGLGLLFLDGRLIRILVSGWGSSDWKDVDEFKGWVGRRYGFKHPDWRVLRLAGRLPPGVSPDALSDTHELDCAAFRVVARCVVFPNAPDSCELIFMDTAADEIVGARIRAAIRQ